MNSKRLRNEKKLFELHHDMIFSGEILSMLKFFSAYVTFNEADKCLVRKIEYSDETTVEEKFALELHNKKYYEEIELFFDKCINQHNYYENKCKYIAEAIVFRGIIYEKGFFGINVDLMKAYEYYTVSCQFMSPLGIFKLAQYYEKGIVVDKDIKKALHLYKCAAKLGIVEALHTYGTILIQNSFSDENSQEIGLYYLKASFKKASTEYPYPCYDYGRYLEHKLNNYSTVAEILYCYKVYLRGAFLECPNCSFRLAVCYEKGELGKQISIDEAIKWYKVSALKGNHESFFRLSMFYLNSLDINKTFNGEKAYFYCLNAAVCENLEASRYMCVLVRKGIGVTRSDALSRWWELIYHEFCKIQKKKPMAVFELEVDSSSEDTDVSTEVIPQLISHSGMVKAI